MALEDIEIENDNNNDMIVNNGPNSMRARSSIINTF
jgi:hypothetical protein